MTKRIAVIGAGSSGLVALKTCLEDGFLPVCFERYSDIGGIWNYNEQLEEGRASVYKSCVINTSKEMMAYSDFPMPTEFPPFMPHHTLLKYLRMYTTRFDLLRHIRFNTNVLSIRKAEDYENTGCWVVTFTSNNERKEEIFHGVMVCTGHHSVPYVPEFRGDQTFKGTTFHSQQYRTPDCFKNKRVLVIGIGNSAVDIAVDASSCASQVYLSTRRGAWVVSRMGIWGLPNDMLANSRALFYLSRGMMQKMVEVMANFKCDHEVYGLKPLHRGLEAHPTINDDLPNQIMKGNVKMKCNVSRFTDTGVFFEDNSFEQVDVIVYATGYEYQCPFLDSSVLQIKDNRTTLYKYVFSPKLTHPTLGIVGLVQAVGAVMPLAEIQSRWFCKILKGECVLPSRAEMLLDIAKKENKIKSEYLNTPRHALETMWVPYMDEIAQEIGVRPKLWKLAQTDPKLALRCLLGPCVPAQYRLQGPNQWKGAKRCIEQAYINCKAPLTTRKVPAKHEERKVTNINICNQNGAKLTIDRNIIVNLLKVLLFIFLLSCL